MALLYISFGLLSSVIGVIIDKFKDQYDVSLAVAALLPFAFFLAYGLTSIPLGLAMDRHGAKKLLIGGTITMALGSFLLYASTHYLVVVLMIFIIGIGVTAIQIAGNPFIRELDTPQNYNANLTAIIGIGALGYAVSPLIVPVVQTSGYSWSTVYLLFGILNLGILALLMFAQFPQVNIQSDEKIEMAQIKELLKSPIIQAYALGIFLYVGGEVGVSSYILTFMSDIHGIDADQSFWSEGSLWYSAFPSKTALVVGLFWLLQAVGRVIISYLMKFISERTIFIIHSVGTVLALLFALYASPNMSLVAFALVGYFTCASFTAIFSATINSFDSHHGTISGILGTAIVGGAVIGWLVGSVGQWMDIRWGMMINVLAFAYVAYLAIKGKGKMDMASAESSN